MTFTALKDAGHHVVRFGRRLTDWEKKFTEDLLGHFRQWRIRTKISPKQWEIITRISEKIKGGNMQEVLWCIYAVLFIEGAIICGCLMKLKEGLIGIKTALDALIKVLEKK